MRFPVLIVLLLIFLVCSAMNSCRGVTPSPGRAGATTRPSATSIVSSGSSCRNGLAPSEYSITVAAGLANARLIPALNESAEPQQCGASSNWYASASAAIRRPSVGPPQIARSGCSTSTASISIRSRKSNRVNSLSPAAIAMLVEERTAAAPRRSSALTGSSNHLTSNGSTPAAKRLASDGAERTVRVDHQTDARPERASVPPRPWRCWCRRRRPSPRRAS